MPNMKCPKCSTVVAVAPGAQPVCSNCGFGASAAPSAGFASPPAAFPSPPAYGGAPSGEQLKKGMGIAGMVLGILGLCVPYLGVVLAIIGLVLSAIQLKRIKAQPDVYGGRGMAMAGLVCSIVGVAGAILILIFIGAILAAVGSSAAEAVLPLLA